jgi:hypothetical protein
MAVSRVVFGLCATLAFLLAVSPPVSAFLRRPYVQLDEDIKAPPGADVGEPLLITPLREAKGPAAAR